MNNDMNNEEYENKGFSFKSFLLKLILIIVSLFLLVWLLSKFLAPAISKNIKNNGLDSKGVEALTSQIFNDNLTKMKNAAIPYYTDERLPHKKGESKKMTLKEMIELKIISPLTDKNNKLDDENNSYVKITKEDGEYVLKVNLVDSEKEDYILVHLGCYTYCENYLCEKKPAVNVPANNTKPSVKPSKPVNPKPQPKPDKPEEPEYLYEYAKNTESALSDWGKWSSWYGIKCGADSIVCSPYDVKCLEERKILSRKEKIGQYDKKYQKERVVQVKVGSYKQKACADYNYVIINKKTYAVSKTYSTISFVSTGTQSSVAGWDYMGRDSFANPPRDTNDVHYVFAGADYSYCHDTCQTLPNFYYDQYKYTGGATLVGSTTATPISDETSVSATCSNVVEKNIDIYKDVKVTDIATRKENLYGTVCYASNRKRELLGYDSNLKMWSFYNNERLLNDGWHYTGNKKVK